MTDRRTVIGASLATIAGAGLGLSATTPAAAETTGQTVRCSFKVVDKRGRQRFLAVTTKPPAIVGGKEYPRQGPENSSYLVFNDENGDEKGGIVADSHGALVSLDYATGDAIHLQTGWQDKRGGASLIMNHMPDPASGLGIRHFPGVELFTSTELGSVLSLCDTQGRPRIRLRVAMDGTPSISVLDEDGTTVRSL
ncbi:hypothetical protein [Fodinicola acaciae]|uniref:hypothetical protein n=1 Tax=Fodinicola acaciae TaxID=2681555 RepID=UPI0013D26646|nr:hypothetical protein [Fodinicola acaciae]